MNPEQKQARNEERANLELLAREAHTCGNPKLQLRPAIRKYEERWGGDDWSWAFRNKYLSFERI